MSGRHAKITGSGWSWNLKRPCEHCPFRTGDTAIRFRTEGRAAEIEESAYRNGFPCHKHAAIEDDEDGGSTGYYNDGDAEHCAGALLMYLSGAGGNVPYEWLPGDVQERIGERLEWDSAVFDDPEAFIAASAGGEE